MSDIVVGPQRRSLMGRLGSELRRDPLLAISGFVCVLMILMVLFGPLLAPYSPSQTDILAANQGVSIAHWLGTDELGRDILSRILYGARLSLIAAALVAVFAATFGTSLAIVAAWYGGRVDRTVMRFANVLFAIPSILIAIIGVAIIGPGLVAPVIALSIAYSPYFARIGRSVALPERNKPYVDSCLLVGFSGWRVCLYHLFPNMRPIVLAQVTITFGTAIIDLAAISFIGLGVQPPSADWGLMVSNGRAALLNGYPMQSLSAGVFIVVSVIATMVFGERLAQRAKSNA